MISKTAEKAMETYFPIFLKCSQSKAQFTDMKKNKRVKSDDCLRFEVTELRESGYREKESP